MFNSTLLKFNTLKKKINCSEDVCKKFKKDKSLKYSIETKVITFFKYF